MNQLANVVVVKKREEKDDRCVKYGWCRHTEKER